ncbi:hypothetical protein [Saccharomonospora azurea]|nr:hypothetical protein [Saccharomonospora azurea]
MVDQGIHLAEGLLLGLAVVSTSAPAVRNRRTIAAARFRENHR